jgi:protein CpxP
MKRVLLTFISFLMLSAVAFSQGEGQRQTIEERTKSTVEKMADLKLSAEAKAKTETILLEYYKAQQKAMEDMRAAGSVDREQMRQKRQELASARDEKLKLVFTAEQMKMWIDQVEPSLRPQRRSN